MEEGKMEQYDSCSIDHYWARRALKMTQMVLLQSFDDKYEIPEGPSLVTLAIPGTNLMKCDPKLKLMSE